MQGTVAVAEPQIIPYRMPEIMPRPSPDLKKTHLLKIVTGLNMPRQIGIFSTVCGRLSLKVTDRINDCDCEDCFIVSILYNISRFFRKTSVKSKKTYFLSYHVPSN